MSPFSVILSAPSGAGKTTIARRLLERRGDLGYSVSCTTRPQRPGEVDGHDYHFLSRTQFEAEQSQAGFAEWAAVHGHYYGTLRREVERVLATGHHCLMDIDVQGARQFQSAFPDTVLVFIMPPSAEVLLQRLSGRGSETGERLLVRLRNAKAEIADVWRYQYVVVNDDLGRAVERVSAIIDAESVRRHRVLALDTQVEALIEQLDDAINGIQRGV
jgi:guanylate kinase